MIVIVSYDMGNSGSILNMLKRLGASAIVSGSTSDIWAADKLILPGVGAFDTGMRNLRDAGLVDVLNVKVLNQKTPTLGICLGMQLFGMGSEEGELAGLGWIDAQSERFRFDQDTTLKIPHMGWNSVRLVRDNPLFGGLPGESRFYFVHSYHLVCSCQDDVLGRTFHGYEFTSVVQHQNIFGTQFHPEKSHRYGMKLLKNFIELV